MNVGHLASARKGTSRVTLFSWTVGQAFAAWHTCRSSGCRSLIYVGAKRSLREPRACGVIILDKGKPAARLGRKTKGRVTRANLLWQICVGVTPLAPRRVRLCECAVARLPKGCWLFVVGAQVPAADWDRNVRANARLISQTPRNCSASRRRCRPGVLRYATSSEVSYRERSMAPANLVGY